MSFFGFCIRNILKDVVDTTVQKGAQIIDCHSAQWFIVTQAVNRRTADPVSYTHLEWSTDDWAEEDLDY